MKYVTQYGLRFLPKSIGGILVCAACALYGSVSLAQTASPVPRAPANTQDEYQQIINRNTVTVLGASLSGSYIQFVDDIARTVNDGHNLRILPIIGEGGSQNIRDILYLKGVDAGIVMSNSLDTYNGQPLFENLEYRLQYIARLYEEEFHVVTDKTINSLQDLQDKKVGFHGGAHVTGQDLLSKFGVKPAEAIKINFFQGLEAVKNGEMSAIIRATASPMKDFEDSFDPEFHKLLAVPFEDPIFDSHLPAKLTHKQYPKIIPEGQTIETPAIGVVLASYAWKPGTDRYRRVAQFVEAFFSGIDKLLADKKRHRKWDDVNLAATLPGWTRFPAAEEWLKANGSSLASNPSLRKEFSSFLEGQGNTSLDEKTKEALFKEFQKWRQTTAARQ